MTTAHRPTFHPARGGTGKGEGDLSKLSQQYSSKDMPSHLKLKYRQSGQGTDDDVKRRDLRRELENKEKTAAKERRSKDSSSSSSSSKKPRLDEIEGPGVDSDDPYDEVNSDDSDSDDEDDTAALMAELEKIKKERAAEKAEKEEQQKRAEEKIRMDNILQGNPLLNLDREIGNGSGEFKVKRRWDDDVVFKNCARGIDERKKESTFINDAIRSEFHRKFMDKYIK